VVFTSYYNTIKTIVSNYTNNHVNQMDYISESELSVIVQKVISNIAGMQSHSSPEGQALSTLTKNEDPACSNSKSRTIAIGSDHGGFDMKTTLIVYLKELGQKIIDCGTNSKDSVDYPDFALAVAEQLGQGHACCGIVIDGAGIGSCMAANKVPGIRAAMCYDYASAVNSREHNNANVLTLGAGLLGINQVKLIVKTWLDTEFGGGRHQARIDKITAIEKRFIKDY